jgi:hypothetical protein
MGMGMNFFLLFQVKSFFIFYFFLLHAHQGRRRFFLKIIGNGKSGKSKKIRKRGIGKTGKKKPGNRESGNGKFFKQIFT